MTIPNINFTFIFGLHATNLSENTFGILGSAHFSAHLSLTATLNILLRVLLVVSPIIAGQHITPDGVITRVNYGVSPDHNRSIVTED